MPPLTAKSGYTDQVFINCPFDRRYLPLLHAIVFTVYKCKFVPFTAMIEDDSSVNRIDKIKEIIRKCKYGMHDISRTQLNKNKLPRFNMPFERGIFYGAKYFGDKKQNLKNALIMDKAKFRYQEFLSDISGVDIKSHDNKIDTIIEEVRSWLRTSSGRSTLPGPVNIIKDFKQFYSALPRMISKLEITNKYALTFNDYCKLVEEYISL